VNDPFWIGTELFHTENGRRAELFNQVMSDLFPTTGEGEKGAGRVRHLQHRPERYQIPLFRDHKGPSAEAQMKRSRQHCNPEWAIGLTGGKLRGSPRAGQEQDRIT
jgi:hypothetical protein